MDNMSNRIKGYAGLGFALFMLYGLLHVLVRVW